MARVVFDSFEPNSACFESSAAKPAVNKTDECEVQAAFHAEGAVGYDPNQPPIAYFRRRGTEFYLDISPDHSVSVGLLRGLGYQDNDSTIQSKIYYAIGLSDGLKKLYDNFVKNKNHPVKNFTDLVSKYKNFLITGTIDSADPITKSKTAILVEAILSASEDALEFIDTISKSFQDPQGNQSRVLPEMIPKVEWLSALIRLNIDLPGNIPAIKGTSPDLYTRTEKWIKQIIVYLGTGFGDPQALFDELSKLCDIYREQGNIPTEYKNLAGILKQTLGTFYDIGNASKSPNVQRCWNQTITQLMEEEIRYHLTNASQSGSLQTEIGKELRDAKLSKHWLEDKDRIREITDAVFMGAKPFIGSFKELLFTIDPSSIESAVKKMVAGHGIQEREYIIGTLAVLRFIKSQGWLGIASDKAKVDPKVKFRITAETNKALEDYEQKLIRKLSSSLAKTNIVLPLVEAGICIIGGALAGTGGGIGNRNLTLTGSTITGFGCSALAFHFIPSRNDYIKDPLVGLLGAAAGFTISWFATQNMGMPPPNMMMPPDPNARNPVSGFGP